MPKIALVAERAATGRVREIYDEIKAVLGTAVVPVNFWAVAHNPEHLEAYWHYYKAVMEGGSLDKALKEVLAMVVSALNYCEA